MYESNAVDLTSSADMLTYTFPDSRVSSAYTLQLTIFTTQVVKHGHFGVHVASVISLSQSLVRLRLSGWSAWVNWGVGPSMPKVDL